MGKWYYEESDLRTTPSVRQGLPLVTEQKYRKEGAKFIIEMRLKMNISLRAMATGVVYYQRFYMLQSFSDFPRYPMACACLFLAGKVEETPKKCKDVVRNAREMLGEEDFLQFGHKAEDEVKTLEKILLQTMKFDLQVEHPYKFITNYAKFLKGDKTLLEKTVQMAWNFANDSFSTTLCLQWEPEIVAIALLQMATKLNKFCVVDWVGRKTEHLRWWDMFVEHISMDIVQDICLQVLDVYSNKNQLPSTPTPPTTSS